MEIKKCKFCEKKIEGRTKRQKNRKFCSIKCALFYRNKIEIPNLPHYPEIRKRLSLNAKFRFTGKKHSLEHRLKARLNNLGAKSHFWKGGVSSENKKFKESLEYQLWREAVIKRDNYLCIWCKIKSHKVDADHIKPFSEYPELRVAIDNGQTLCRPCHIWKTEMDRKLYQWGKAKLASQP